MLIVANWKMQLTYSESLAWIQSYKEELSDLVKKTKNTLVLCPSAIALAPFASLLSSTSLRWGAQDCSCYERGAYTGDISVLSLQELGCGWCIVGHSERRKYHGETSEQVAMKAKLLIDHGIQPIVCIGETEEERLKGATYAVLQEQLEPVLAMLDAHAAKRICFAYEPVWAIGTGKVPAPRQLKPIIEWLIPFFTSYKLEATLLYGGSVQEKNIHEFKHITGLDGFLVGKASIDFQILKKIVIL
jgi:triosephosphate isomerase (TIM)